jgi:hypothetical protein
MLIDTRPGNLTGAGRVILQKASFSAQNGGFANIGLQAERLEARMADAETYAKSAGYLNTSRRAMTRAVGVACYDAAASEDIAELGLMSSNSLQDSLVESFTTDSVTPAPAATPDETPLPWLSSGGDSPAVFRPALVVPPVMAGESPEPFVETAEPVKRTLTKKRSGKTW